MEVIFQNITKRFGDIIAVHNLDLKVESSEFLILLGPSGCGKTTTLRMVAGLETMDMGNIYIGESLVNDLPPKDRNVAMVFQNYALYPHMNVYNNIAFDLRVRKTPKEEVNRRVRDVTKLLGIDILLDRRPSQLSGGEQQRVALGRAIVREPNVFLMDEPLSNIDAKLRVQMRAELQKLHRKLRTTTIYVTHDQEEAMTIGQRVAVLKDGVLQQVGTPREVYNHPVNLFVASFVGSPSINLLEGIIAEKKGTLTLDIGPFTYTLPKKLRDVVKERASTREVILGVRPEDVTIGKEKGQINALEAEVDVLELVGREIHVQLRVGEKMVIAITNPFEDLKIGEKVWLEFNEERLYLFDKKTEKSIV
jgi:multiple sugar transport system ATP-binding protein